MTTTESTTSESTDHPTGAADAPMGELVASVDEPQTLYILSGDTLLLPGADGVDVERLQTLHDHFELRELIVHDGLTRPWILRKGHALPAAPRQDE